MSEFSFDESQNYESLVASYAPFPGAQLVEVAVLSEDPNDPKVGIYRADNGTDNGEDLIVMLPSDFPDKPVKVGVDINDFDPRRQQLQKQYFVPKPELPAEKQATPSPKPAVKPAEVFDYDIDSLRVVRPPYQKPIPYFSFTELKQHLRTLGRDILDLPEEESGLEHIKSLPSEINQILRQSKRALLEVSSGMAGQVAEDVDPRKVAVGFVAASILASGGSSLVKPSTSQKVSQENVPTTPVVYKTPTNTVVELGDISDQDIEQSILDSASASAVAPESQQVVDSSLLLPLSVTSDQVSAAYLAFIAPETLQEKNTDTSTPAVSEVDQVETPAEVVALNTALEKIGINASSIDIAEVIEAAKSVDRWYAPQDKDRRPEMPDGYVKLLLPSEAIGLGVPMTVSQRTADSERYASAQMVAVQYVTAKLYQELIETKYPQMAGEMFRIRDNNSPIHKTHNDGRNADMSGALGWEVEQYSDGGFADYQFSERFNKQFTIDMAVLMSKMTINGERVISSILSSGNSLVPEINNIVGFEFMIDHDENHQDHFHVTLDKRYALPNWRVRAGELPWSIDQDLRIAGMAQDIAPEQHASQHADHEAWVHDHTAEKTVETAPAPTPIPEQPAAIKPEALTPEAAQLIDQLDLPEGHKEFLRIMLPSIMANYHAGAKINPAVVLAQTSLETGFGNDTLSEAADNYFGMKAGKKWNGPVYNASTKEEYTAGEVVTITDGFRDYANPAESVADYAKLIQGAPHYADAVTNYQNIAGYANGLFNEVDNQGNIIKEQGEPGVLSYGTDRGYEQKIFSAIEQYGYEALIQAQSRPVESVATIEESTENATTTTAPNSVEVVDMAESSWFDVDRTRHTYKPYFRDSNGHLDLAALGEWVDSLPQKTNKDGQVMYQVSIGNMPKLEKGE